MSTHVSNFARRFPWVPILAIAAVLAIAAHAEAQPARPKTFQIAPAFEEERGNTV